MAELDSSAFSQVLSAFRRRLSAQDIHDFQSTTFEDLKEEINRIQTVQAQRRGFRNLNKVRPFVNGIEQYSKVIEVFANAKPDIMAFIWGPIKFCLQIASKLTEAFDALLDAYEKIGKSLPLFSKIDGLFLSHGYVQQVLVDVYEDILDFHKRAIIFFKQSAWRLAFKVTIHTFADMFGDVIKKLERSRELLLHSANIAHYQEAQAHYKEVQSFRLLFAQEFEAQLERTRNDRKLMVMNWLSSTSCDVDHEELQRKRNEFPDTARWIFKEDSMCRWLQPDGISNPMFWICGIPGAGKTVLFSSIVDQIKCSIPNSQVLFFYCKNRDPHKKTFDGIARSLIAQLLHLNPVSLDFLYNFAVDSGERHPTTFKTYERILEHITSTHDLLFIGIDGLDECEKDDRRLILSLLDHVLKVSSPQAKIKIFLASQKMNDLENMLKLALRFDIKHYHIQHDIENYVHRRASQLCDNFDLSPEMQSSIAAKTSNRSEGMFLLARLIMDNLMAQDNIEELEEELSPDILPKGIDEAYGRILVRLGKGPLKKRQERATRVLELIVTARYPLKVQELQGALCIRLEDLTIDFAKRRTFTPFNELCGPIVEVHADDTISLVHPTARQFLVQDHSGPLINLRASRFRMASLCAQYLNFKCFGTLHSLDNQTFVTTGAYAFQEYATLNWIYHILLIFSSDTSVDGEELAALMKSCLSLKSIHCGPLSEQQQALSLQNSGYEDQNFQAEMKSLQKIYESVYSISDSDQSESSVPYPLRHLFQARSMTEKLFTMAYHPSQLMIEAYGTRVFKCSVVSCPRFRHGYKNNRIRDKHQLTHQGEFECTYKGCDFSILGFSTSQALANHLAEHNPPSETVTFPKVQRCSLRKSLESAVDQDDAVAVRALCAEGLDSLLTGKDMLKRALNKKSSEAAKVLLQVLTTDEVNTNSIKPYARKAMHLAAEKGDEELTNLIIAIGADLGPKKSGFNPLSIAAKRGDAQIVKLLLKHSGHDLNLTFKGHQTPLIAAAEGGHESVLCILLEKYGEAYAKNKIYYKAIQSAGSAGHRTVVKILLEYWINLSGTKVLPTEVQNLAPSVERMLAKIMPPTAKFSDSAVDVFRVAVCHNEIEKVLSSLQAGADVNAEGGDYGTALQTASYYGYEEIVRLLLENEAVVNTLGGYHGTALQAASANGHEAIARLLLKNGAVVNTEGGYYGTALQAASRHGHEAIAGLLLENGADVNIEGGHCGTALQAASFNSNESITRLLLENRANVNTEGGWSGTALQAASANGHEAIARLLLKNGAVVNTEGGYYGTALQAASRHGHEAIAGLLLDNGADVNIEGGNFGTALQAASFNSHEAITRLLLENGANVNTEGGYIGTPLQAASFIGHEAITRLLLDNGADVDVEGRYFGTALHAASFNGHEAITRLLLENGADVNTEDGCYVTALQAASANGQEAITRLLLENGADVNIEGGNFGTALQAASFVGHEAITRLLLENGAHVNIEGGHYGTALQAARGNEKMESLLLKSGAIANN